MVCKLPLSVVRLTAFACCAAVIGTMMSAAPMVRGDELTDDAPPLSPQTRLVFSRADRALKDFDGYLRSIRFENGAFIGTNYFAVSVGGIDAIKDLEESRGVDPETFAALYAGYAIPSVAKHLNLKKVRDAQGHLQLVIQAVDGRLRYKGSVVRLYSPDRLREMFDRRAAFNQESERRRKEAIAEYVYARRRETGNLDISGQQNEVSEIVEWYRTLQPLLSEVETALQNEVTATSIIGGSGQHLFGISVGGINVQQDLVSSKAVDPETFAAIYAQRVSADYADAFQVRNGRIEHGGVQVKLYSADKLETYFRRRDRLTIRTARP